MEKTLYQACKDFVNKVGEGNEFKTKEFTNEVGEYCTPTRWNLSNNNPYYRAHTYKTFFKNSGIISQVKRGVWKVNAPIPSEVTLTDFQYDMGYTTASVYDSGTRTSKFYKIKNNPFDFKAYLENRKFKKINKVNLEEEMDIKDRYFSAKSELEEISEKVKKYIDEKNYSANSANNKIEDEYDDITANAILAEAFDDIVKDLKPGDFVWNSIHTLKGKEIDNISLQREKVLEISILKTLTDVKIKLITDKNTYDEIDILNIFKTLEEAVDFLEIKIDALNGISCS